MTDSYLTINGSSTGEYSEKRSKFLAFAFHVENTEEVKQLVQQYEKEYYDARHVCYAYVIGHLHDQFRAVDNGEPSGTAGKPILGQLTKYNLTNTLVIVVRYFGGIKLGIPGLIRAYKTSTSDALSQAETVRKVACKAFRLDFGYLDMNAVMKVLKDMGLPQSDQDFGTACSLRTRVPLSQEQDFRDRIGSACTLTEI